MQEEVKEPVSMFVLFARMFSITAKNLEKEFGEKGLKVLEDSVKEFGIERGKDIAARAKATAKKIHWKIIWITTIWDAAKNSVTILFISKMVFTRIFTAAYSPKPGWMQVKKNTDASIAKISIPLSPKAITKTWNVYMTISCMLMVIAPSVFA